MSNQTSETHDFIDNLFAQARTEEPYLNSESFMDDLFGQMPESESTNRSLPWLADIVGALAGFSLLFALLSPNRMYGLFQSFLPSSVTLSLAAMVVALLLMTGLAVGAWYAVEGKSSRWP